MLVIWILSALTMIAMTLSSITRLEIFRAYHFREAAENRFLAEAGIDKAIMELSYRLLHGAESGAWKVDGTAYELILGGRHCQIRIRDESGKLNINKMTDKNSVILRNLLINVAGVDQDRADIVVDSVLDWKEPDNFRRTHGAADDYYYLSLPDPYKARHAPFETPEELLMARGMSGDILFGSGQNKGIMPFITLFSPDDRINVETASREVLSSVPGIGAELADKIIEMRSSESTGNRGGQGILKILAQEASEFVFAGDSGHMFGIESTVRSRNENTGFRIETVVTVSAIGRHKTMYYKNSVCAQ